MRDIVFMAILILGAGGVLLYLNWDWCGSEVRWLMRKPRCWAGMCRMVQRDNETYIWGECLRCGRRTGVVSREACERYMKAEERRHDAICGPHSKPQE